MARMVNAHGSSLLGRGGLAGFGLVGLGLGLLCGGGLLGGRRGTGGGSFLGRGLLYGQSACATTDTTSRRHTFSLAAFVVLAFEGAGADLAAGLGAAFFSAGGEPDFLTAVFFANLTGPDGPFGRSNSPLFSPDARAWEISLFICGSVVAPRLLLAWTYFLMA